jgi:hypothetical protein
MPNPNMLNSEGDKSGGRPEGVLSLTGLLKHKLAERAEDGRAKAEEIVETLIDKAAEGDPRHIKEIFDRIDGRGGQAVSHEVQLTLEQARALVRERHRSHAVESPRPGQAAVLDATEAGGAERDALPDDAGAGGE